MPKRSFLNCQVSDDGIDGGKRVISVQLRLVSSELLLADSLSEVGAYPSLGSFLKSELTPVLKRYVKGARDFVERAAADHNALSPQNLTKG